MCRRFDFRIGCIEGIQFGAANYGIIFLIFQFRVATPVPCRSCAIVWIVICDSHGRFVRGNDELYESSRGSKVERLTARCKSVRGVQLFFDPRFTSHLHLMKTLQHTQP